MIPHGNHRFNRVGNIEKGANERLRYSKVSSLKSYLEHNIQKKENEPSIPATGMAVLRQQYVLVEAIQAWIASLKKKQQ